MNKEIAEAVKVLKRGGTILYPTDTIWGIGCDATNETAVEKVFKLKRRADSKSLIILAANPEMVNQYVEQMPEIAYNLIEINDKPMTIIYPQGRGLAGNVVAADGSVGIRVPLSDFCVRLITSFGRPIVSTSANISGEQSPGRYGDISQEIIKSVDYAVSPELDLASTRKASQIIKIGMKNEIEIIRS